jgi:hypothetical protein
MVKVLQYRTKALVNWYETKKNVCLWDEEHYKCNWSPLDKQANTLPFGVVFMVAMFYVVDYALQHILGFKLGFNN